MLMALTTTCWSAPKESNDDPQTVQYFRWIIRCGFPQRVQTARATRLPHRVQTARHRRLGWRDLSPKPPLRSRVLGFRHADRGGVSLFGGAACLRVWTAPWMQEVRADKCESIAVVCPAFACGRRPLAQDGNRSQPPNVPSTLMRREETRHFADCRIDRSSSAWALAPRHDEPDQATAGRAVPR
jgi:hypothetical protein